jgi:hypothetical protein
MGLLAHASTFIVMTAVVGVGGGAWYRWEGKSGGWVRLSIYFR